MRKLTVFFLLLAKFSFAQVISGTVIDSSTKKPVPYVGIGILHKGMGTVSDFNGNFSLDISGTSKNDTIRFSTLGYSNINIPVNSAMKQKNIYKLAQQSQNISEVIIKPGITKTKILGNTINGGIIFSGFNSSMLGTELGTVLKYRKKNPGHIKTVNFNMARNVYDSVLFKVNIYRMSDSGVGKSILTQPIYLEPTKKRGILTIDVSNYSIYITHDVLLSLELLKMSKRQDSVGQDYIKLWFYASLFNSPSYYRKAAQDDWVKMPADGGVGFWATVTYKK